MRYEDNAERIKHKAGTPAHKVTSKNTAKASRRFLVERTGIATIAFAFTTAGNGLIALHRATLGCLRKVRA